MANVVHMNGCISRIVLDTLRFGDDTHKFYTEARCNRPCIPNKQICLQCICKVPAGLQHSRKCDHGTIHADIPDHSHIYGGKWYHASCKKWKAPSETNVNIAMQHHISAIHGFEDILQHPIVTIAPNISLANQIVVPPSNDTTIVVEPKNKRGTKRATAVTSATAAQSEAKVAAKKPSPKKASAKEPVEVSTSPYTPIIESNSRTVYKEVNFPTYIEKEIEEICTEDYEIEYVTLSAFQVNSITYFRNAKKNKLYKRIKDKQVGEYIGRYDPATSVIHTDIPDSDDEEE